MLHVKACFPNLIGLKYVNMWIIIKYVPSTRIPDGTVAPCHSWGGTANQVIVYALYFDLVSFVPFDSFLVKSGTLASHWLAFVWKRIKGFITKKAAGLSGYTRKMQQIHSCADYLSESHRWKDHNCTTLRSRLSNSFESIETSAVSDLTLPFHTSRI